MPPCVDVYVWVDRHNASSALSRFIRRYVDVDASRAREPRVDALIRVHVQGTKDPADVASLRDLARGARETEAFSIYLAARAHYAAIITITDEEALVLGLSLDDPQGEPAGLGEAADLLRALLTEFDAAAGLAGIELAPPQSRREWQDDAADGSLALLRAGQLSG